MSIPKRNEVPEKFTWNLQDIFVSDEAWQQEYEALKAVAEELVAMKGTLGRSADDLLRYLQKEETLSVRLSKFYGYASCKSDEDTANNFYQDFRSKAVGVYVSIKSASAFAVPEIMAIPQETLDGFYASCPALETYRRVIFSIRRKAAHILSDECETLLAAAGEMANAPENINGIFRDADLTFPEVFDKDGKSHALTNETLVLLLENEDRTLRKHAFETYYKTLGSFKNTVASTLDAQFKQLRFFADARKYPSTLEASLDDNEVPTEVYNNLINAVHQNLDKMYRYVSLRKKLLHTDELHMYDVYTPIVPDTAVKISYDEAKQTVLKALSVLGDDYLQLLQKGFDERWIDVYENVGKRGGAYSAGNAYPHPYVLLNHKDNLDSMFTLAHEMGHALHSYHSCKYQPACNADYVIFVAEVASTCNEVLLMKYLLKNTEDKMQKAYLINHFLDQFKGTVYRQTMFAEFELTLGKMSENGDTLTADALCEKYLALNKLYFGPDMISDKEIALEWARIPHFFYDYYVFQYATGFSAAVAIANRILEKGETAVQDYKRFLSGGSSTDPISLLKIAGVDMSSSAPINSALVLFGSLIDELDLLMQ